MKRVYIIHGWGGSPDEPLHKWLKSELEKSGFEVITPKMPNPNKPVIEEWVSKLKEIAGTTPDKDSILVGHSIGCQTILRYLEEIKTSGFVGGVVFIAPWLYLENLEREEERLIAKPWVDTKIHNPNVFKHIPQGKMVSIFSDNDPYVPEGNRELFEKGFGARIVVENNKGHFTAEDGVTELPSALEAIKGF